MDDANRVVMVRELRAVVDSARRRVLMLQEHAESSAREAREELRVWAMSTPEWPPSYTELRRMLAASRQAHAYREHRRSVVAYERWRALDLALQILEGQR